MEHQEFLARARLDRAALEAWMSAGWLVPDASGGAPQYSEGDLARAHLINDLRGDVGVNDEGIAVILHLLDQLLGLRRTLGDMLSAMRAQPDEFRERLAAELHQAITRGRSPAHPRG